MTDTEEALLPCPFCGSSADYEEFDNGICDHVVFAASCNGAECPIGFKDHGTWPTIKEAIKAWNTRAALNNQSVDVVDMPRDKKHAEAMYLVSYRWLKDQGHINQPKTSVDVEALKKGLRHYSVGGTPNYNNQVKGWNDCLDHLASIGALNCQSKIEENDKQTDLSGAGDDEYMCPNCVTPWKCNGPHIPDKNDPSRIRED